VNTATRPNFSVINHIISANKKTCISTITAPIQRKLLHEHIGYLHITDSLLNNPPLPERKRIAIDKNIVQIQIISPQIDVKLDVSSQTRKLDRQIVSFYCNVLC
jgi:hypothetical protein